MPSLQINCCEDCPFSRIWNEPWFEVEYNINCDHPEQVRKSEHTHKMKNSPGIYFKCPLDKDEDEDEDDSSD